MFFLANTKLFTSKHSTCKQASSHRFHKASLILNDIFSEKHIDNEQRHVSRGAPMILIIQLSQLKQGLAATNADKVPPLRKYQVDTARKGKQNHQNERTIINLKTMNVPRQQKLKLNEPTKMSHKTPIIWYGHDLPWFGRWPPTGWISYRRKTFDKTVLEYGSPVNRHIIKTMSTSFHKKCIHS